MEGYGLPESTITVVTLILTCVGVVAYCMVIFLMFHALRRIQHYKGNDRPMVSVVISARNEQYMLGRCLDALISQDYPADLYEIIIADDRSEDDTGSVIDGYAADNSNIVCVHIEETPSGISPKKYALSCAISRARGEIVLQTDADCVVPPGWISGMVSCFAPDTIMVCGIAPYFKVDGLINTFVRHEYVWNAALSASTIALGRGSHASGRNLGFRRHVFDGIGGYKDTARITSGDDTLLLHRIQAISRDGVVSQVSPGTHVYTDSPKTWVALLRQRTRHMSTGRFFDPVLLAMGIPFYLMHMLLLAGIVAGFILPSIWGAVLVLFAVKCLADCCLYMRLGKITGLDTVSATFPAMEILMVLYFAVVPVLGLIVPVKWKEKC